MKLISIVIALLAGLLASTVASAGVAVAAGWHGGHGGHHAGWAGHHGGWHGGSSVHFGVVIGPPFWGYPRPYYYPYYYPPPVYYAPPPTVYYTNPPVVVAPSQPVYTQPPLAAPAPSDPVVELPPKNAPAQPSTSSSGSTVAQAPAQLFMYPRQGQDAQLQAHDRDECYRWALNQLGYDPGKSTAGLSASQSADYYRAISACLDGRGYSVR